MKNNTGMADEELLTLAKKMLAKSGGDARVAKMTPEQHAAHGRMMVAAREAKGKERKERGE